MWNKRGAPGICSAKIGERRRVENQTMQYIFNYFCGCFLFLFLPRSTPFCLSYARVRKAGGEEAPWTTHAVPGSSAAGILLPHLQSIPFPNPKMSCAELRAFCATEQAAFNAQTWGPYEMRDL